MGLWDGLFGFFSELFSKLSGLLEYVIKPTLDIALYTPIPKRNGQIALVNRPTNAPWGAIYDVAHDQIWPLVLVILVFSLLLTQVLKLVPQFAGKGQRSEGNIIATIIATRFAWPFGVFVLSSIQIIIRAIAPTTQKVADVVTAQLLILTTTAASLPGINVLSLLVGGADLSAFLTMGVLYIVRLMVIFAVMMLIYLLAAFYLADVPILNKFSEIGFTMLVGFTLIPIFLSAGMRLLVIFFEAGTTSIGSLSIGKALAAFMSVLLPTFGIILFGGSALTSFILPFVGPISGFAGKSGSSSGTDVSVPGQQQFAEQIEEKAAGIDERVQSDVAESAFNRVGSAGRSGIDRATTEASELQTEASQSLRESADYAINEMADARQQDPPTAAKSFGEVLEQSDQSFDPDDAEGNPMLDDTPDAVDKWDEQIEDEAIGAAAVDPGVDEPVPVSEDIFETLDQEQFERYVETQPVDREGVRQQLEAVRREDGQERVDEIVRDATTSQAAAESTRDPENLPDPDDIRDNELSDLTDAGSAPEDILDPTPTSDGSEPTDSVSDVQADESVSDAQLDDAAESDDIAGSPSAPSTTATGGGGPSGTSGGAVDAQSASDGADTTTTEQTNSDRESETTADSSGGRDPVDVINIDEYVDDPLDGVPGDD